jgi:hypothetical protein
LGKIQMQPQKKTNNLIFQQKMVDIWKQMEQMENIKLAWREIWSRIKSKIKGNTKAKEFFSTVREKPWRSLIYSLNNGVT